MKAPRVNPSYVKHPEDRHFIRKLLGCANGHVVGYSGYPTQEMIDEAYRQGYGHEVYPDPHPVPYPEHEDWECLCLMGMDFTCDLPMSSLTPYGEALWRLGGEDAIRAACEPDIHPALHAVGVMYVRFKGLVIT